VRPVAIVLTLLAFAVRLAWVLAVPTAPTSDFAMYRESASYLAEFGALDHGFIYMPGFVALLAWIQNLGGELLAQKMVGVACGALGAGALYLLTARLFASRAVALVAALLYTLWPAGVGLASVVGTDVPAAALMLAALAALATLGPRRPWRAALAFGVIMGLTAWVRAVALPLTFLALGYWLALRVRALRSVALTGAGVAATLLVLAPWGVHHLRESGHLYFTDDHGGITALIGADPNSEGRYSRALNRLFHDVTGREVLAEPHHDTDRVAFALARDFAAFEPAYAAGLVIKKAERLFEPERRMLYWSVFRPGVLPPGRAGDWFARHHDGVAALADAFGLAVAALALAGVVLAVARRLWPALALLPFALALIATYSLFFAEPRYRLPIEALALPFAALALVELGATASALGRRDLAAVRARARPLAAALAVVTLAAVAWPAILAIGARWRSRHQWAATSWQVDGHARLAMWRPTHPTANPSPIVAGAPDGLRVRAPAPAAAANPANAAVTLQLGRAQDDLPAGAYALRLELTADDAPVMFHLLTSSASPLAQSAVAPGHPATVHAVIHHGGGRLGLGATLSALGAGPGTVWISGGELARLPASP
jgi:hypothetical protein